MATRRRAKVGLNKQDPESLVGFGQNLGSRSKHDINGAGDALLGSVSDGNGIACGARRTESIAKPDEIGPVVGTLSIGLKRLDPRRIGRASRCDGCARYFIGEKRELAAVIRGALGKAGCRKAPLSSF
jgi:hypothetical protein